MMERKRKAIKQKYKDIFVVFKAAIDELGPCTLVAVGAPKGRIGDGSRHDCPVCDKLRGVDSGQTT